MPDFARIGALIRAPGIEWATTIDGPFPTDRHYPTSPSRGNTPIHSNSARQRAPRSECRGVTDASTASDCADVERWLARTPLRRDAATDSRVASRRRRIGTDLLRHDRPDRETGCTRAHAQRALSRFLCVRASARAKTDTPAGRDHTSSRQTDCGRRVWTPDDTPQRLADEAHAARVLLRRHPVGSRPARWSGRDHREQSATDRTAGTHPTKSRLVGRSG